MTTAHRVNCGGKTAIGTTKKATLATPFVRMFYWAAGAFVLAAFLGGGTTSRAATTDVIYSFSGDDDGEYTDSDVEVDATGNLYGTSVLGGDFGGGTVWQLSPVGGDWIHTVLYSFTGSADGGEPYKGVSLDSAGNLYGTAVTGGSGSCEGGCGVTYKLTKSGDTWTQRVIHAFTGGADGSGPGAGNLYGTAVTGGSGSCEGGCGVTYKLTKSGDTWTQRVIHAFTGGADGSGPGARVAVDKRGNVYGMTPTGGANGVGTIYVLRPRSSGGYNFRVIHTFTGGSDGSSGSAGRMVLRGGRIFGAATTGGTNGAGTVFQLTPTQNGEWDFKILYSFQSAPDGVFPYGALLFDSAGNLYGTTYYGGTNGLGAVYKLSPTTSGEWDETIIHSFQSGNDGNSSISNLVADANGNLYGTTSEGGFGSGTIFQLSPGPNGTWTESIPHSFQGSPDGAFPYAGMVSDGAGSFFGATVHGGDDGDGAIYKFTP